MVTTKLGLFQIGKMKGDRKTSVQGACKKLVVIMECEPNWIKRKIKTEDEG